MGVNTPHHSPVCILVLIKKGFSDDVKLLFMNHHAECQAGKPPPTSRVLIAELSKFIVFRLHNLRCHAEYPYSCHSKMALT